MRRKPHPRIFLYKLFSDYFHLPWNLKILPDTNNEWWLYIFNLYLHYVFHLLILGWENGGFSHWCRLMLMWRVFSLSRPRSQPSATRFMIDKFSTPNWVKTTQRPYPAVSTQHLGWENNPALFCVFSQKLVLFFVTSVTHVFPPPL